MQVGHGDHQVRPVLAHIADLDGIGAELVLDRPVPLLRDGGLDMRIPNRTSAPANGSLADPTGAKPSSVVVVGSATLSYCTKVSAGVNGGLIGRRRLVPVPSR